jgi:hypothetical protein
MAKKKTTDQPKYVDLETGKLRDVGEEDAPKRPKLLAVLKRAASDAVVRRTSTKP